MSTNVKAKELEVLFVLAEHRMLTVSQLAVLGQKTRRAVQMQLGVFQKNGWVKLRAGDLGRGRGRPEEVAGLTEKGIDLLREAGRISSGIAYAEVTADAIACLNHQILLNWFSIHLVHLQRHQPNLLVRFLSSTSPFLEKTPDGQPLIKDRIAKDEPDRPQSGFIPDAVFSITAREDQKTLLFFLEVDLGTETLATPARTAGDIRQKIATYQTYFQSQAYKRYESIFKCRLTGFRLLLVSHSPARATNLSRLVRQMPPSNFIWVTDPMYLFEQGIGAPIWSRGGLDQEARHSILGGLACRLEPLSR